MSTHLVFLRAVNVGGAKIGMKDLQAWLTQLKFTGVRTLLVSGNAVIHGGTAKGEKLEKILEADAAKQLDLKTDFFVRTPAEWDETIGQNPFPKEAKDDPSHLVVMVLKAASTAAQVAALQTAIKGRERVQARGRHAYIVYPDGIGTSKLTIGVIEKHLGTRATGRNWNTVLKMAALAKEA